MRKYLAKLPRSTEELLRWYERYISPATLLVAFTIDTLAFKRVDLLRSNLLLFSYLAIASTSILLFHLIQSGRLRGNFFLTIVLYIPVVMQFGFGGLFSGFVILYSQSAAYATSWIFIVLLAALLIGNERFRALYVGFVFEASVLFLTLISFLIFFLPVVTGKIGTTMFLLSEALAVGAMFAFVRIVYVLAPEVYRASRVRLWQSTASIFLIFNLLYFTNVIPPLPLALKEAGVYHKVTRVSGEYHLQAEPLKWYQRYLRYNTVFHKMPGETVYVFTSVFAPTRLSTTITHEWQFYDPVLEKWLTTDKVSFPIQGGRDGGYRGYTLDNATVPGMWRVNVRTGDGRLIGKVSFTVEDAVTAPQTSEEIR
ncbi:hypothetical protein A2765_02575 [Candidatus Kaiserbacteria bacterium RIFCSPHIGHO2_01_FULL_56_24]|uniref:DUF2914 domain-containing protein n=1 Tax=Candidatus Kaiserbacteria bacterium RIFCSPHIGHO2_01_FULL_56_24 TaxID=1798487 RepID=A0A1F6DAW9_9BACT|nr:MAG: hypothetical protein A2765_02575 [Candidatus Kaiserbacteria bacterium RIFCSPHIGHO2_01_FULL_56_24]